MRFRGEEKQIRGSMNYETLRRIAELEQAVAAMETDLKAMGVKVNEFVAKAEARIQERRTLTLPNKKNEVKNGY